MISPFLTHTKTRDTPTPQSFPKHNIKKLQAFLTGITASLYPKKALSLVNIFNNYKPDTMNPRKLQLKPAATMLALLSAVLLASPMLTRAQTNIAIAPTKLNVFYIGVDNPVAIAASGAADDKVTVTINGGGGTVTKTGTGKYNVRVTQVANDCVLSVFVDGKLAGTSDFRVRSLPSPSVSVGGFQSGANVAASDFQAQAGVNVYLKDSPFEVQYEVAGFTFTTDKDNGELITAECQGAAFSPAVKAIISQYVKPGRMVTIDNIRVKDPSGKERKVLSLVYYIK